MLRGDRPPLAGAVLSGLLFFHLLGFDCLGQTTLIDPLRPYDPVVVSGSRTGLAGSPLERYGLCVWQAETWKPVPFQLDEVDANGRLILTHGKDKGKGKDDQPGVFDGNDELVFLGRDASLRCPEKAGMPAGAVRRSEIELSDPANGIISWVYLVEFDRPPQRSTVQYVGYDPRTMRISATNYVAQFDPRFPVSSAFYAFTPAIGGDGKDIVDRVKVRLNLKFLFSLDVTEEDIKVEELGYTDGPIRVVVRSVDTVKLVSGLPGLSTTGEARFYGSFADFPFIVNFPIRPTRFRALVYDDFIDCTGWLFYNSNNPEGHPVDGIMDESDERLKRAPWTWSALSNGRQTFWSLSMAPKGCPVKPHLCFNDDRAASRPPEDVPGELPGMGWDFREGWDLVREFPVELRLVHFFTTGYHPGDERSLLAIFQEPLLVEARVLP
jgi:hypothetical protein